MSESYTEDDAKFIESKTLTDINILKIIFEYVPACYKCKRLIAYDLPKSYYVNDLQLFYCTQDCYNDYLIAKSLASKRQRFYF